MPLYKPSDLQKFLKEKGIRAKKSLSQNFLIDGNILNKIVQLAHLRNDSQVVEIGPGPGVLTEALLNTGAHVTAIEMDPVLAEELKRLQTDDNRLNIVQGDALEFPYTSLNNVQIIANLPYHITTPLLATLVPCYPHISEIIIMVQKEVADRFIAKPMTPEYSSFTLFLNFYTDLKYGFTISSHCFYPKPSVDSAVVILKPKNPPLRGEEADRFFQITRKSFGQRRKMMTSSLKPLFDPKLISDALIHIGKNPKSRPEELSLDDFLNLYYFLRSHQTT